MARLPVWMVVEDETIEQNTLVLTIRIKRWHPLFWWWLIRSICNDWYGEHFIKPKTGWLCPACGRGNAPWVPVCDCYREQKQVESATTQKKYETSASDDS